MPPITSFNAGQVSPLMEARADFEKYNSSCRTVENMLVTVQGPVLKRPGTKYIAAAKSGSVRLIPFEYSTDDAYVLEMGNAYIRFYRDGGQILDGGDPYEITTEFDTDEVWDIQYTQTDNSMYLADGNDPPQVLTRTAHDSWTIADVDFTTGPFLPENTTATTITPSGTTGSITLEASSEIFESTSGASHVGSLWEISQIRTTSSLTGDLDGDESSLQSVYFTGGYSFTTTGTWVGTVTLQRSTNDGANWSAALTPLVDTNFDNPAETEEDGAIYRVTMSNYTSGTCAYNLSITDQYNHGIVSITAVTDGDTATATVITDLESTDATALWREGYWSDYRGWPETVAFHQQRLVFGGSVSYPQTIWFGEADPDDYTNFAEGTLDTSAFTIALQGQNPIRWLLSQDYLLIGTSGSCGKYGEQGEAITPTSPNYQEQTRYGSAAISAVLGGDAVLYVERGARRVREFSYSLQYDKYISPDLTILSPEITDSGIKDIAFQMRPDPTLWCVLNDGEISTLTYQRDQSVVAWTKQITDGDFESVAVISGDNENEVWALVERTIDRAARRYVEQFQPWDWGDDINNSCFVDSGLSYDSAATASFSGLDHLRGETVAVLADSIVLESELVNSNGEITIDVASVEVTVGLPFTAKLETLPIRADRQDMAMNKKIKRLWIDFYETGDCKFGNGANSELTQINFFEEATLSPMVDLFTSDIKLKQFAFPYGGIMKATVYLESSKPVPLGVRAIVPEMEIRR